MYSMKGNTIVMKVSRMTEEKIRKEVIEDQKLTIPKIDIYKKRFRSVVLRSSTFPVSVFYECNTESKNHILIGFNATKRGQHSNPNIGMLCIYKRREGKYAAVWTYTGRIIIFAPHFFQRYEERVLNECNLSREEVIKKYFISNWAQVGVEINDEIESVFHCFEGHYNDEVVSLVFATADGYCFGENHDKVSIIKTIITEDMLSERQKKLFPAIRDLLAQTSKKIYGQSWTLPEVNKK